MAWRLAKSLIKLREQINAASPNRNKASDGSIADAAHASRVSDHNPNSQGVVTAIDVTHDLKNNVSGTSLTVALIRDFRIKYVIFNGAIWKARTGKWEKYTGANQHKQHVHISVKAELADDERPWPLVGSIPNAVEPVKPKYGDPVEFVKEFQRVHGLTVDGIPGRLTFGALEK